MTSIVAHLTGGRKTEQEMAEARKRQATEACDPLVQRGLTWMAEERHNMPYASDRRFLPILPGVRNPNTLIAEAKPSPSMGVEGNPRRARPSHSGTVGTTIETGLHAARIAVPRRTEK